VSFDVSRTNVGTYGVAGAGVAADDDSRLSTWPYFKRYADGSAVGYGVVGREPYSASNPDGAGQQSLAYLRIAGQGCSYNVWSKLGRQHLELLLSRLRRVATE
jgi:hypothetical protein